MTATSKNGRHGRHEQPRGRRQSPCNDLAALGDAAASAVLAGGRIYGHEVRWVPCNDKDPDLGEWCYADDGQPVHEHTTENGRWIRNGVIFNARPCPRCGEKPIICHRCPDSPYHDACLGHIEGAHSACCGHGVEAGQIVWPDLAALRPPGPSTESAVSMSQHVPTCALWPTPALMPAD